MIFVTLGTQRQSFKRLLEEIENCTILKNEEIIAQVGYTKYESENIKMVDFMDSEQFNNYMASAEFVITHGGVGSIFTALLNNKKVIAMPRLKKYGEHVDNHQIEICEKLADLNHIVYYNPDDSNNEEIPETLESKINFLRSNSFVPYVQDFSYIQKVDNAIKELL